MENQPTLTQIERYSVNTPFSQTLNDLILKSFSDTFLSAQSNIKVIFVDYEPYSCFLDMQVDIGNFKRLKVSSLHCDNTIFGFPMINQMFRAVHDYLHFMYNLDFSHENELMVNYYQNSIFKKLGASVWDLDLLNIETAGQIVYHKKFGDFPKNQRTFTIQQLSEMGY